VGSCTIRRDEYDVNGDGGEDAGGKDDRESDAARRSTSFLRLLAQLSEGQTQWEVVQYDATSMMSMSMWMAVRMLAAWMIASKTRRVRCR